MVGRWFASPQSILAAVDPLDPKLLSRLDVILLPDGCRQHDLSFAGHARIHAGKSASYRGDFQPEETKIAVSGLHRIGLDDPAPIVDHAAAVREPKRRLAEMPFAHDSAPPADG